MDAATLYHLAKTLHILAFISWMAGMFYLPRLYVYHCKVEKDSDADVMFQTMERKLLRYIMTPAMIITWVAGLWLAGMLDAFTYGWFHVKMLCVVLMSGAHGLFSVHRKQFAAGANVKSERYYRLVNEVPTVLLIVIVALVVFKPF